MYEGLATQLSSVCIRDMRQARQRAAWKGYSEVAVDCPLACDDGACLLWTQWQEPEPCLRNRLCQRLMVSSLDGLAAGRKAALAALIGKMRSWYATTHRGLLPRPRALAFCDDGDRFAVR